MSIKRNFFVFFLFFSMLGFSSYSDFVVAEDKAATTEKVKQEPSHQSKDTTTSVDQTTEQFSVDSNDEKVAIDVSDGGQNIGQQVNTEPEDVDGDKLEKQSGLSEQMPSDSDNTKNADASDELQSTDTQTNREKDKAAKKSDLFVENLSDQKLILDYLEQLTRSNLKMSQTDNEQVMDKMLGKENIILGKLVTLLGKSTIDELPIPNKIERQNFLNSRIAANEERGNDLAIQRDKIKLAYYKVSHDTLDYLQYLMTASRSYVAINEIVNESVTRRNAIRKDSKRYKIPEFDFSSKVHSALKKNSVQLNLAHDTYRDILTFVIANPDKISTTHWFQKVSLLSSIAFFNNFDIIRSINHKLTPFRVDVGGIIVSLIIVMLVVFCYPLVVKGISWVVEKYFLNNGNDYTEEIYRELKRPVFALIVFFSLDLATYALLYKTEYKSSLEDLVFVVYVAIYLWIIFKVMDSVVIAQLDKFSKKINNYVGN